MCCCNYGYSCSLQLDSNVDKPSWQLQLAMRQGWVAIRHMPPEPSLFSFFLLTFLSGTFAHILPSSVPAWRRGCCRGADRQWMRRGSCSSPVRCGLARTRRLGPRWPRSRCSAGVTSCSKQPLWCTRSAATPGRRGAARCTRAPDRL